MQYKYNERHLNHIVIYCCYSILEILTYSLNCVWNFLRVYCINRILLQSNIMNTINKVTFLNYWSIPPISDSTNSRQKIWNWLPNVGSDSLAEKWQSHLALSGRLLRSILHMYQEATAARSLSIHNLFPHVSSSVAATTIYFCQLLHTVLHCYWVISMFIYKLFHNYYFGDKPVILHFN